LKDKVKIREKRNIDLKSSPTAVIFIIILIVWQYSSKT